MAWCSPTNSMSSQAPIEPTTAACLTPPAAGGIAVVQVIGPDAPAAVNPLLRARRPIDVSQMPANALRFCRVMDRGEILDDAVIAARKLPTGSFVVDINLHGGPRIVQRLLLALKSAGVYIVEAHEHVRRSFPMANLLTREAMELLPLAKTRAVAAWLARASDALARGARRVDELLQANDKVAARMAVQQWMDRYTESRYLVEGVRVVLTGRPNSGKSTLANALAGAEHAIVSETAGTTRDWVEIPAAVDGVPVTLVDTAGVRETTDPLERESIHRAGKQLATANLILHVIDRIRPPTADLEDAPSAGLESSSGGSPRLVVWNKSDLPPHPGRPAGSDSRHSPDALRISARTGQGLPELRQWIIQTLGLTGWKERPDRIFTARQRDICRLWLSSASPSGGLGASGLLDRLTR